MLRRCIAEALGAFAIVFFGCGAAITLQGYADVHFMVSVSFGLVVAAGIYAFGHLSAAHFNPAVTLAFAIRRRFPWQSVPPYILAQCTGALSASSLHAFLFPVASKSVLFGATMPKIDVTRTLVVEGLLTFFLMVVIMAMATDKRVPAAVPGLVIGLTVSLCAIVGGPVTGGSMNPARSLGPAVVAGGAPLSCLWIYILAPVVGAVIGATLYDQLRGEEG
jgi:MIP family channel proteins